MGNATSWALFISWGALAVACRRGAEEGSAAARASASAPASGVAAELPLPERTQDAVSALEAVAKVHRDASDCDALAKQLAESEARDRLPKTAPDVMLAVEKDQALAERVHHAMEDIMTASMKCRGNAAFEALHTRIRGARGN
jgi:hypothetical protein